jgi:hypothetical protein
MGKEDLVGGTIYAGTHGDYRWLASTDQYMGAVVQHCPEIFLGRYLVVTTIDSGMPWLTEAQRAAGWELRSGMACNERVSSADQLFYQRDGNDCPGYDEWYCFSMPPAHRGEISGNPFIANNRPRPGCLLVFVGWGAFVLHESGDAESTINEMFWQQLNRIRPDFYVSDGRENLTFVCKDHGVFDFVYERLSAALKA